MIPPRFEYHAPTSVGEAIQLLNDLGDSAKLLAGGHSLLPMMKLRFAAPEHLIDINRIPELRGVREGGGNVVIGAMTTETEVINSPVIQAKLPLLSEAAKLIADPPGSQPRHHWWRHRARRPWQRPPRAGDGD